MPCTIQPLATNPWANCVHVSMEAYESVAWRMARRAEKVQSPENLAALAAPQDNNALLLQRMEDSNLRRLWRLTQHPDESAAGGTDPKRC